MRALDLIVAYFLVLVWDLIFNQGAWTRAVIKMVQLGTHSVGLT